MHYLNHCCKPMEQKMFAQSFFLWIADLKNDDLVDNSQISRLVDYFDLYSRL